MLSFSPFNGEILKIRFQLLTIKVKFLVSQTCWRSLYVALFPFLNGKPLPIITN